KRERQIFQRIFILLSNLSATLGHVYVNFYVLLYLFILIRREKPLNLFPPIRVWPFMFKKNNPLIDNPSSDYVLVGQLWPTRVGSKDVFSYTKISLPSLRPGTLLGTRKV